jgi:hypothetical protein
MTLLLALIGSLVVFVLLGLVVVGILSLGPIGVAEKSGKRTREHSSR